MIAPVLVYWFMHGVPIPGTTAVVEVSVPSKVREGGRMERRSRPQSMQRFMKHASGL